MTGIIRDVMAIEFGKYKHLGGGAISYKKDGKTTRVEFNDVYNTLVDYGVDDDPKKIKEVLTRINK